MKNYCINAALVLFVSVLCATKAAAYAEKEGNLTEVKSGNISDYYDHDALNVVYVGEDWCGACKRWKELIKNLSSLEEKPVNFIITNNKAFRGGIVYSGDKKLDAKINSVYYIPKFYIFENGKAMYASDNEVIRRLRLAYPKKGK